MTALSLTNASRRATGLHSSRGWRVSAVVVVFHLALIWAAEHGLLQRPAQIEVARVIMATTIVQAQSEPVAQERPQVRAQPQATLRPAPQAPRQVIQPSPTPSQQAESAVAPALPAMASGQLGTSPAAAPTAATTSAAPVRQAGPAIAPAPELLMPSADADYLNNPPPVYPRQSKRMGEQGTVVVRVLIGLQGTAEKAEIRISSGFARLDQAALETVQRWRYVPGKRNGAPEAMWFNVPVRFILE
jgi:periplasmic protein TonB